MKYKINQLVKVENNSKDWVQYKIEWGEDNWEIADEKDLIEA